MSSKDFRLEVVYLPVDDLKPYEKNARKHADDDINAIAASIKTFGFRDPVGIWRDNLIVEGHGRVLAAKKLGMEAVPCIRLDDMTDEERRAYALAHNRTAELSAWDYDLRDMEIEDLSFDMTDFGFDKLEDVDVDDLFAPAPEREPEEPKQNQPERQEA